MPVYRFWRLRKLIRDTSNPIEYEKAKKWDTRLGFIYNICAYTSFPLVVYIYFCQQKKKHHAAILEGKPIESSGQYWARTLGIHGARVVRFGPTGKKLADEIYLDPERLAEEKEGKPKGRLI